MLLLHAVVALAAITTPFGSLLFAAAADRSLIYTVMAPNWNLFLLLSVRNSGEREREALDYLLTFPDTPRRGTPPNWGCTAHSAQRTHTRQPHHGTEAHCNARDRSLCLLVPAAGPTTDRAYAVHEMPRFLSRRPMSLHLNYRRQRRPLIFSLAGNSPPSFSAPPPSSSVVRTAIILFRLPSVSSLPPLSHFSLPPTLGWTERDDDDAAAMRRMITHHQTASRLPLTR